MNKDEKDKILKALDALALALTEHDHEWTEEESQLYVQAIAILKRPAKSKGQD